MEDKLVYANIFKTALKGLKSQFWLLVGLIIGFTIIYSLLIIFTIPEKGEIFSIKSFVIGVLCVLLFGLFLMGYMKNCLQTLDGEEPQFSAYGQVSRNLLSFLISYLLYMIIVVIGTALLIVPGVYIALRLQFFFVFIVDDNCGIIESFKRSWNITNGLFVKLFILMLIMALIFFIGCFALVVGIFVAAPLITLMYGYAYRKLTEPAAQ